MRKNLRGEMLGVVPFADVGADFGFGKLTDGSLDFLLFRAQLEIQDSPRGKLPVSRCPRKLRL